MLSSTLGIQQVKDKTNIHHDECQALRKNANAAYAVRSSLRIFGESLGVQAGAQQIE